MSKAVAEISRSVNNGPVVYTFAVDGALQNAAIGVANMGAAMDAVKPLITALPGTVQKLTIIVTTV